MTVGVDRRALHWLLWGRSSGGVLRVDQQRLADELCVTKWTMSRVIARMIGEGRITQVGTPRGSASRTYEIVDPAVWRP